MKNRAPASHHLASAAASLARSLKTTSSPDGSLPRGHGAVYITSAVVTALDPGPPPTLAVLFADDTDPQDGLIYSDALAPKVGDTIYMLVSGKDHFPFFVIAQQIEQWANLALVSPWVSYGSQFAPPAYRIEGGKLVRLRGIIKSGTASGFPAFTLPDEATPPYSHNLAAVGSPAGAQEGMVLVQVVGSTGATPGDVIVYWTGTAPGWVSLDGITFPLD